MNQASLSLSKHFPQELIDIIIGYLAIFTPSIDDRYFPSPWLTVCSQVSRSFAFAARRHIFHRVVIGGTIEKQETVEYIEALAELLEDNPTLPLCVHTLSIQACTPEDWPCKTDAPLHRILTLLHNRPQKLPRLILVCSSQRPFTSTFGPLTQQAIYDVIPNLKSLSLTWTVMPMKYLYRMPPLDHLYTCGVSFVSNDGPTSLFQKHGQVESDVGSLEEFNRNYSKFRHHGPAYQDLIINLHLTLPQGAFLLDLLQGSLNSLETLELVGWVSLRKFGSQYANLDFGPFAKLKVFRVHYSSHFIRCTVNDMIESVRSAVEFALVLLHSTVSPSTIARVDIKVSIGGFDIESAEEVEQSKLLSQCIDGLNPMKLLPKHPLLEIVTFKISLPIIYEDEYGLLESKSATLALRKLVRVHLENTLIKPFEGVAVNGRCLKYDIQTNWIELHHLHPTRA